MRSLVATSVALLVASFATAASAGEIESGLKVGDRLGAYNVKDITGPNAGKSLCYRWRYGARPVVNVFTRSLSDNLASLVKQIDKAVGENEDKKMAAFVVLLTDDPDAAEEQLKEFGKKHKIEHVPLTMFDGIAGPPGDKLSKDAEVTVHMYVKKKMEAKHAFGAGKMDKEAIDKIIKDNSKILD